MKTLFFAVLFSYSASFACNQRVYDSIYKHITILTLEERATVEERNTVIEEIRALCNGQLSTYEKRNPIYEPLYPKVGAK